MKGPCTTERSDVEVAAAAGEIPEGLTWNPHNMRRSRLSYVRDSHPPHEFPSGAGLEDEEDEAAAAAAMWDDISLSNFDSALFESLLYGDVFQGFSGTDGNSTEAPFPSASLRREESAPYPYHPHQHHTVPLQQPTDPRDEQFLLKRHQHHEINVANSSPPMVMTTGDQRPYPPPYGPTTSSSLPTVSEHNRLSASTSSFIADTDDTPLPYHPLDSQLPSTVLGHPPVTPPLEHAGAPSGVVGGPSFPPMTAVPPPAVMPPPAPAMYHHHYGPPTHSLPPVHHHHRDGIPYAIMNPTGGPSAPTLAPPHPSVGVFDQPPIHPGVDNSPEIWQDSSPSATVTAQPPSAYPGISDQQDKRKLLFTQFGTLASRLGIALPQEVLQSLTDAAMTVVGGTSTAGAAPTQETLAPEPLPPPVAIVEARVTAEQAIAAVKRSRIMATDGNMDADRSGGSVSSPPSQNTPNLATKAPPPRRRKKPRLTDCENKLAELRAENELLKRHLDNVTSQSQKFDQAQRETSERMKTLLADGDTPKYEAIIQEFFDLYTDFGKRRHEELTFHLDQLKRLANPTNFTKMGLYTIGHRSNLFENPMMGLLQKELGLNEQQIRKLSERRDRVVEVCANMRESVILLGKLKSLCEQKTNVFQCRMNQLREILTPRQVLMMLTWVNENSELLNRIMPTLGRQEVIIQSNVSDLTG